MTNSKLPKSAKPKAKPRGGSRKGCPNKVTATVKEALEQAFKEVGGARWLVTLAETDPKAFAALIAKLIPAAVHAEISGPGGAALFSTEQLRRMADLQEDKA